MFSSNFISKYSSKYYPVDCIIEGYVINLSCSVLKTYIHYGAKPFTATAVQEKEKKKNDQKKLLDLYYSERWVITKPVESLKPVTAYDQSMKIIIVTAYDR
jgi:hypothetical protein